MLKVRLRREVLANRREQDLEARMLAAEAIAAHGLAIPTLAGAQTVACYLSMPSEPGTGPLLHGLLARGVEVLVPLIGEPELEWAQLTAENFASRMLPNAAGMREPDGPRLPPETIERADMLFIPGLAVDHRGYRLGRGGGFYDRVLHREVGPAAVVLFADEVVPEVPIESHDRRVDMALTPLGAIQFDTDH